MSSVNTRRRSAILGRRLVRLDRIEAQCPLLGDEIDEPFQSAALTPPLVSAPRSIWARPLSRLNETAACRTPSAEAHVAPDVDRPALAAAQRLLEVDADDAAFRRLQRRRSSQRGDGGGGRNARGLDGKSGRAAPGRRRPAEIGERRAEIRVGQFAAGADLEVLSEAGEAASPLRRPPYARRRSDPILSLPSLTMRDAAASASFRP